MKKVNITIGRFQPFTMGHLKCCEDIYNQYGLPTVLLVIAPKKVDKTHPFDKDFISKYISKIVNSYKFIAGFIFVKSANIVDNAPLCRENGFEPVSLSCGTDRAESYKRMTSAKYREMANLSDNFIIIEIPRRDTDISGTMVRNAILDNRIDVFEKSTPKAIHSMFYKMKKYIEKVNEI